MKKLIYSLCLLGSLFTVYADKSPYDAARNGDLDTLRHYRFEGIDLFVPDERGFIPYELAALHADPEKPDVLRKHVEAMLWLKEYQATKHRYGKASIALVQAGLNALGYPVGNPDGIMGSKTADAIRTFQKDNDLAETGRLGPQWLGLFYQDIVKDMQFKLTKLGYDTKGTDGMMGKNTRNAMLKYRQSQQLSQPEYPHLDALLLNSINQAYAGKERKYKAAIAQKKQQAKETQMRFVQAGLRTLGYRIGRVDGMQGSKTANAIKKFQKRYKLSVNGEANKQTLTKMQTIFLKETQRKLNYLGYKVGKPDGKNGKKTMNAIKRYAKNHRLVGNGLTASLIMSVDDSFDNQVEKRAAKKASSKRKATRKTVVKKSSNKKRSSSSNKGNSTKKRPSKDVVKTVSSKSTPKTAVKTTPKTSKRTTAIKGNHARGRMRFSRKGGRVVGCSIAGRGIPIEWCEPFYPLPKNNHCEATFKSSSGAVVNLWCK